jgi:hypothetical protein
MAEGAFAPIADRDCPPLHHPISAQSGLLTADYATVVVGARITVELAALRAQDRDLDKYQKWANRVADGVKARFEWPE